MMPTKNYVKATVGNMPELPYAIEEAVNRLRVNVGFLGEDIRKIMVISTTPDEGKSFVTMQLWRQLAEAGTPTALIDMDLRKSVMVDKYQIAREDGRKIQGTSYYLANKIPLEQALLQTNIGEGAILPNVDNVLDCPPLDLVSDGERIGALCDGAILVVRGSETPKSMIRNSIRQLERANCPLLGVVLNRVKGSGSGYYYKQYGGKYGYYGKDGYYYK